MKKSALACATALLLSSAAHAALVTVEYKVPVNWMSVETATSVDFPTSNDLPGFTVAVGDILTGRFTYDDATPLTESTSGIHATGEVAHSLTFGEHGPTIAFTDPLALQTNHLFGRDSLNLFGDAYYGSGSPTRISVVSYFAAPLGTTTPGTLPSAQDWQQYHAARPTSSVELYMYRDGTTFSLSGDHISLQVLPSVPEPATWGMLAAGLGLTGWAAQRRKSPAA